MGRLTTSEQATLESCLASAHKSLARARSLYDARDDYELADELFAINTHLKDALEAELKGLKRLRTRLGP